jgi:succinylglutamic semialdehyde dehydrogenase
VADLDEAIAVANDTPFGLSASVFSASAQAVEHAAEELRVGVVHHNRSSAGASGRLPFGGVKQSGNYRPAGILAGTCCSYPQALLLSSEAEQPPGWWPGLRG